MFGVFLIFVEGEVFFKMMFKDSLIYFLVIKLFIYKKNVNFVFNSIIFMCYM